MDDECWMITAQGWLAVRWVVLALVVVCDWGLGCEVSCWFLPIDAARAAKEEWLIGSMQASSPEMVNHADACSKAFRVDTEHAIIFWVAQQDFSNDGDNDF